MKKWEDIVKDRLEGYESTLPEGSFAAFRARRDGVGTSSSRRIAPWIWGLTAAVAAGLASLLFLRFPETDGGMETGSQPDGPIVEVVAEPVSAGTDSSVAAVPDVSRLMAQGTVPKTVRKSPAGSILVDVPAEEPVSEKADDAVRPSESRDKVASAAETSPFLPAASETHPSAVETASQIHGKAAPIAGGLLGAGTVAALVARSLGTADLALPMAAQASPFHGSPNEYSLELLEAAHHFPLKADLSTRIPLANHLYLTTGLAYARYTSDYTYSLWGKKRQVAQYLGIPLRLDWVFDAGKWLDVYVGGGVLGDVCVGASFGGEKIRRDGPSLSVMGAGGVQWNVTKRFGVYIEPALNWQIPFGTPVLETYRTVHPVAFTTTAGLRINLDK